MKFLKLWHIVYLWGMPCNTVIVIRVLEESGVSSSITGILGGILSIVSAFFYFYIFDKMIIPHIRNKIPPEKNKKYFWWKWN